MRKLLLIIFLAMGIVPTLLAQSLDKTSGIKPDLQYHSTRDWPLLNSEWYYELQPSILSLQVSYQHSKITKDTLIQSKKCMVWQRQNALMICESMGRVNEYLYKSNDTVYWYNPDLDNFTILYVFSANAGDRWEMTVNTCSFMVVVDSVGSETLNGKAHKILFVHSEDPFALFSGKIIENVGHTRSFFPRDIYSACDGWACDSEFTKGLRCFLVNDTLSYHLSSVPCDTTYNRSLGIFPKSPNADALIAIYPNPVNDFFSIQIKDPMYFNTIQLDYQIYNAAGELLKNNSFSGNKPVFVGDLSPGLYLIRIFSKTQNKSITSKFLKL